MGSFKRAVAMASAVAVVSTGLVTTGVALAQTDDGVCDVAFSGNNLEQPRWEANDIPNMEKVITDAGGTFTWTDARLDSAQQQTDVETLINGGADVLVMLAQDQDAALAAIEIAQQNEVPIIAYDRLIEDPSILYITFDNVRVGELEAEAILNAVPSGTYVLIKGDPGDPNASTFLPQGWNNAGLQDKIDAGEITIFADQFTDGWRMETALSNMEAIIDAANSEGVVIDAILAENDSTALGVASAVAGKGLDPIPLSGQDGDAANLQNVAAGWQYVDVWKNANELGKLTGAAALQLCEGVAMADLTVPEGLIDPAVAPVAGPAAQPFETPGGNTVTSFVLTPTPITQENLNLVVDGGWIALDVLCANVDDPSRAAPICADAAPADGSTESAAPEASAAASE
jgi:D-xylose transport system substrate-binding protein